MSLHPTNDNIMIEVESDKFGFSGGKTKKSTQSGVIVELPAVLPYLGFHSFAFENSFLNKPKLDEVLKQTNTLIGKRVYWTKTVDIGSTFKQDNRTLVFIKLTDIIAVDDKKGAPAAESVETQSDMNVELN